MAPKGAQQPASLLGTHSIKWLVIDSAPLFQSPLSSLRNSATHYLVTSDVVAELRDKRGRALLDEAKLQLPADTLAEGQEPDEMHRNREGFEVRDPTPESVAKSASRPPDPPFLLDRGLMKLLPCSHRLCPQDG